MVFTFCPNFGRCQADFWRSVFQRPSGGGTNRKGWGEFNDSSLPFVMYLSSPTHAYYLDLRQNPGAGEVFGQDSNINVQSLIGPYGHTGHPQPGSNSEPEKAPRACMLMPLVVLLFGRVTLALNTLLGVRNYVAYLVDSSRIELIVMDPNRVRARSRTQDRLAVRRYRSSER